MKTICKKLNNYLQNLSPIKFIIAMVISTFLILIPYLPIAFLYEKYIGPMGGADAIKALPGFKQFMYASIICPLLETFFYQYCPIELLRDVKIFKGNKVIIIIISALLFGLAHTYSYLYVLFAFILGLVFAYSYYVYIERDFSPFWIVFWIHSIRNTISTILVLLGTIS